MNELKPGQAVGNYILDKPLGKGGLGEVWLAHHAKFTNKPEVAIKFVLVQHTDMFSWFEREAKILDKLRANPHIITAEDYGEQNGLPYLVMKYAASGSLSDRINRPLPPAIVVNYVAQIADALDFAHSKTIVHRDLKPSNILFHTNDQLLLADFGIAHDDDLNLTQTGVSLGTPGYMAPEQFLDAKHVGPAADIYSLGVLAFRMLAGQLPFQGRTQGEFEMNHRFTAIPLLHSFIQYIPPNVQPVLEKVLAKNPEDRYKTAGEFSRTLKEALGPTAALADLELTTPLVVPTPQVFTPPPEITRVSPPPNSVGATPVVAVTTAGTGTASATPPPVQLNNQVEQSIPPTTPLPPTKKSNLPLILGGAGLAAVLVIAAIIGAIAMSGGAKSTPTAVGIATSTIVGLTPNTPPLPTTAGGTTLGANAQTTPANPNSPISKLGLQVATPNGAGHTSEIVNGAFSPDGSKLVTTGRDQSVRLWDASTGKELGVFLEHSDMVEAVAFSPDGKLIATGGSYADGTIRLWDGQNAKSVRNWKPAATAVLNLAFSPDGKSLFAQIADNTVRVYETQTGIELKIFNPGDDVRTTAFSLDGTLLASGHESGTIKLWDAKGEANQTPVVLTGHTKLVQGLDFSADGKTLASSSEDGLLKIWSVAVNGGKVSAQELKTLPQQSGAIPLIALNPDGKFLVTRGASGDAKYWNIATGVATEFNLADNASFGAFSSEGSAFAVSNFSERNIKIIDIGTQGPAIKERVLIKGSVQAVTSVAFSPDGGSVVTANETDTLTVWDAQGKALGSLPGAGYMVVFGSNKNTLFVVKDMVIRQFSLDTGKEVKQLTEHKSAITSLAASQSGKTLVSTDGEVVRVWDSTTGQVLDTVPFAASNARFSGDGDSITAYNGETVKVFDFTTRKLKETNSFSFSGYLLSVSSDGKVIAVGSYDLTIRLFDKEGKELTQVKGPTNALTDFAYMPGRSVLAAISKDNTIRVWDIINPNQGGVFSQVREAKELVVQSDKVRNPTRLAFSPNGKLLVVGNQDGSVQLWDIGS